MQVEPTGLTSAHQLTQPGIAIAERDSSNDGARAPREGEEGVPAQAVSAGAEALYAQRRLLRVLTALAVLLLAGSAAWLVWHEREQELEAATLLSMRRAGRLAEELTQTLDLAKVAIAQAEARLQRLPDGAPLAGMLGEAPAERAQLLSMLPLPFELHALDAKGRALDLARGSGRHSHDVVASTGHTHGSGGLTHTRAVPAANTPGWQVGTTQGVAGARIVPLLRRAASNSHGIAAYAVDLDHQALLRRFEGTRVSHGGGVALFRIEPDGSSTVLARAPHNEVELGQRVPGPLATALTKSPRGTFDALTHLDQTRRLIGYQRLEGDASDLVVAYSLATDAVLAGWQASLPWIAAVTLLLAAGLVIGGRRLDRSLRALSDNQRALERSESHFRALADNLPDVVVRMDREGRHLYANAAVGQATGMPPEAFIGKTNAELGMPQDNVAVWMSTLARVFERGRMERLEFAYPGPQRLRHWESLVRLEPTAHGEAPTALVISRDITERKQAEAEREALNRRLVDLLETMSDGFVSLDRQWRYRSVNRKASEILGRDAASLIGKHIWTEFPEGVGQPFHRAYERAMNEGTTIRLEEYYPPWDAWLENRIYPTADGISVFFTDVTERRRAADALKRSEQRLREAQRMARMGNWELELKSGALAWSDEIFRIFEIDPARFGASYQAFLTAIHPDDRVAVDRAYRDSVTEHASYGITHRLLLPDGRIKHVHEQGASSYAADGTPLRSMGTVQDVTERVLAEQALRDSEARHREMFESNPHPMWVYDLETLAFLAVNDAAIRHYGYGRDEFLHMTIKDIRPAEDVVRLVENVAHVTDGLDEAGTWRHVTKDGRLLEVEITSHTMKFDGRPAELVLAHDVTRRNEVERALRDSEERLRLALQAANQGLYDLDLRTGEAKVSPEYARMLGYEPETFLETNAAWRERMHPDDQASVYRAYEQYVAGRLPEYRVEFRQRTKDGGWKWILSLGKVQERDAQGLPVRMLGTHTDITPAKEVQAALAASEARLTHLLRSAPTVIYTARAEGDYGATYYSPNVSALLGWQPEQFTADPAFWLDHVHPEDRQRLGVQVAQLIERGEGELEYRFQNADGGWRWMRDVVRFVGGADGEPAELVGSWIDITDRREAEDQVRRLAAELDQRVQERTVELARSEARYRTIFETVPVSISEEDWSGVQQLMRELRAGGVTDGPGYFAAQPDFVQQCLKAVRVERLNQKALALYDAHDTTTRQPSLQAFYPSLNDLPQFVPELEALWAGRRLYTAKRLLPSVSGQTLSLMMTMSLPGLDHADGLAMVCLVDITEIDRLNAELDQSVASLRQVNRELETFTYTVSHDLKAPLRGIDGYSRLLLSDHEAQLDDEGREFLGRIRQATQHMGALIDDLLAYSRVERRELTLTALPLAALVDGVLESSHRDLAARGVELDVRVPPELRAVGDTQGLTIALRNLVDNALKFTADRRPPRITIVGTRNEGVTRLSVGDNGLGFDMKFHDRIFAIFQRLHRAEDYPGTGVGLAIVRKAMERMGGRVWAESAPGQGAAFHLELPEAP